MLLMSDEEACREANRLRAELGNLRDQYTLVSWQLTCAHLDTKQARRYARWLRHQGSEKPAIDVLRVRHGLPEWLECAWARWDEDI